MSHIGSFLWALATLSVGGKVVVARATDAHELLPLLREHQPTILAMIPAALSALIHDHDLRPDDFSSLRMCRAGADKVSTELLTEFASEAGFPIVEGYGMTEVGLATLNPPSGEIRQGSIGRPICGFTIALRKEGGEQIEAGEVGRIWIRSRSRMPGYWQAPEATEEVVTDDWLDSGDLARADEDGYLWFFGRKKQVIVHDGSNISPYEVEGALVEHPAVALAGAVGVHDEVHGENVRAYVTLNDGGDAPAARRPDRLLPGANRLQGAGGNRLPRRDAAQPDRQDRPRRAEANGRGPPPSPRPRAKAEAGMMGSWVRIRWAIVLVNLVVVTAALIAPKSAVAVRSEFFGISQGPPISDADLGGIQRARIHTMRYLFSWASVQPKPCCFNWGGQDRLMGRLVAHGIRVVPALWGSPSWAESYPARPPIDKLPAWQTFLRRFARHYGPGGSYWPRFRARYPGKTPLPVQAYQIWNEPNLKNYWIPYPAPTQYGKLLKASSTAIKGEYPKAKIVLGGMPGYGNMNAWDFLDQLYDAGAKQYFDVAALHPYAPTGTRSRRRSRSSAT